MTATSTEDIGDVLCSSPDPVRMRKLTRIFEGRTSRDRSLALMLCTHCPAATWCEQWRSEAVDLATQKSYGPNGVWSGVRYGKGKDRPSKHQPVDATMTDELRAQHSLYERFRRTGGPIPDAVRDGERQYQKVEYQRRRLERRKR